MWSAFSLVLITSDAVSRFKNQCRGHYANSVSQLIETIYYESVYLEAS